MNDPTCTTPKIETGHIGLNVRNLKDSSQFYQTIFRFKVMSKGEEKGSPFALLGDGGPSPILTLWQQSSTSFSAKQAGLHHLSFKLGSMDAVRAFETRLKAEKVQFIYDGVVPHAEGSKSGGIFFEDPDGIRLEIYASSGAQSCKAPTPGAPSCGFF